MTFRSPTLSAPTHTVQLAHAYQVRATRDTGSKKLPERASHCNVPGDLRIGWMSMAAGFRGLSRSVSRKS